MVSIETFANGIEYLQSHVTDLREQVTQQPVLPQTLLEVAFETMNSTIEELRVAEAELYQQNEALLGAHDVLETWRSHYEDLFESAPNAYLVTDLGGVVRQANKEAVRLLALSKRFLAGKPLLTFIPEEDRAAFHRLLVEIPREPNPVEREIRLRPRRGQPFEVALTVSTMRGSKGEPISLRWLVRDVTDRNQAEIERYRMVVDGVTDYAIILLDRAGLILDWNPGATHIFGYAETEMRGKDFSVLFTREDRAQGVPAQELADALAHQRADDTRWQLRKDGSRFWAGGVLSALRDENGDLRGYAKVVHDDTARKQEEQRLADLYTREHRISASFQRALLPEIPEDRFPSLAVASLYEAAWEEAQIGGDFYDAFSLDGGFVALIVGDVSGKGLAAAAHTAEVKHALRVFLRESPDPGLVLSRMSSFLHDSQRLGESDDDAFVTLAVAVVNPATGRTEVAVAGAEPPLVLRAEGAAEPVEAEGSLLGLAREAQYACVGLTLLPGDTLIMVTDGITEARRGGEFLDYAGLIRLAREASTQATPHEAGRAILEGARAFAGGSLTDDACLLLARREASAATSGGSEPSPPSP